MNKLELVVTVLTTVVVLVFFAVAAWYLCATHSSELSIQAMNPTRLSTTSIPKVSSTDIDAVRAILATVGSNNYLVTLLPFVTTSTASIFKKLAAGGVVTIDGNFSVNDIFPSGVDIVASLALAPNPGGLNSTYWVFIKEGNEWKFDYNATVAYSKLLQSKVSRGALR